MKLHNVDTAVEMGGQVMDTQAYTIKNSSKMFNILSDKIYKDKPLACVRELSCNAKDASGGKPFDVHLPNELEPWLEVKDYGTGLSPNDMIELYSTYGGTSKDESNLFIGALGLGSKVGFSYTKSFTTSSRWDGTEYVYVAAMDRGVPQITMIKQTPTDEPNGLSVRIPVKRTDVGEFHKAAVKVLSRFNPKPNVTGYADFTFDTYDYVLEGDGWGVRKNKASYYSSAKLCAVMGEVAYPINVDSLRLDDDDSIRQFKYVSADLTFNLGDLDISASREELSYDDETIQAIRDKLHDIKRKALSRVILQVKKASSFFEAHNAFREGYSGVAQLLGNRTPDDIMWKMRPVRRDYIFSSISQGSNMVSDGNSGIYATYRAYMYHVASYRKSTKSLSLAACETTNLPIKGDTWVVYIDTSLDDRHTRTPSRILAWMKSNDSVDNDVAVIRAPNQKLKDKLIKDGIVNLIDMQDIPDIAKAVGVLGTTPTASILSNAYRFQATRYSGRSNKDYWFTDETPLNLDEVSGYYVDLHRWKPVLHSGDTVLHSGDIHLKGDDFNDLFKWLVNIKVLPEDCAIYGTPASKKSPFKGHANWTELLPYADTEALKFYKKNGAVFKKVVEKEEYDTLNNKLHRLLTHTKSHQLKEYKTCPAVSSDEQDIHDAGHIRHAVVQSLPLAYKEYLDIKWTIDDHDRIERIIEEIKDRYPMLKPLYDLCEYSYSSSVMEDYMNTITDYIETIERNK